MADWIILGSKPCKDMRFISAPVHPDQLWCPTNLLFNRYLALFPPKGPVVEACADHYLHQVLTLRQSGAIPLSPLYADMVLYTDLTYIYSHVTKMYTTITVMMVIHLH